MGASAGESNGGGGGGKSASGCEVVAGTVWAGGLVVDVES